MKNKINIYLLNNCGFILLLLKKQEVLSVNKKKYNFSNYNLGIVKKTNSDNNSENGIINDKESNFKKIYKEKSKRCLKQIDFISKMREEHLLYNTCLDNKIIFVEGIKAWEKYGVLINNYSYILYDELTKININDNFFSFKEKSNKILFNIIKSKIKRISEDKNKIGSAVFCGLYFNRDLDKMISISVGNILYSILRESSRQKYEIVYISTEQYHDINIPYQLSAFNEDYNYINIKFHNINANEVIIIGKKKGNILSFIDEINSKKDKLYNIEDNKLIEYNNYLAIFKINNEQINALNSDNLSIFSTSSSW